MLKKTCVRSLSWLLILALFGCSGEPTTALRVRITASDEVIAQMSSLHLSALREEGGQLLWRHQWDGEIEFPADLTFTMGVNRDIRFTAQALDSSGNIISQDSENAAFEDGKVVWLDLDLSDCEGCVADGDADADADSDGDADADAEEDVEVDADPDFDGEGIHVNPGCDETVQTHGIDAAWTQRRSNVEYLYVTQGIRRWALNLNTNEWEEFYVTSDMANYWLTTTMPDTNINPGQDPNVQDVGIDAAFTLSDGPNEDDKYLIVILGTMFWTQELLPSGEWIGDATFGADTAVTWGEFHDFLRLRGALAPGHCLGSTVSVTNPGEDLDIQANGVNAISRFGVNGIRIGGANRMWYGNTEISNLTMSYSCLYSPQTTDFLQRGEICTPDPGDEEINPACDAVVIAEGIGTSYFTRVDGVFHVVQGTHHWGFSSRDNQWVTEEYTNDLAARFRGYPPNCDAVVAQ